MKFFNSGVFLTAAYGFGLLLVAVFFLTQRTERLELWPAENLSRPIAYSDIREGGESRAEILERDSVLYLQATLSSGIYHPYAGTLVMLGAGAEALSLEGKDLSNMDSLRIEFRSSADVALVLYAADFQSRAGDPLSFRPFRLDIPATRHYSEQRLALSGLKPSEIWFDIRGMEPDSGLYLDHIVAAAIETGHGTLLGFPSDIEIRKWELWGTNRGAVRLSLIILGLISVAYGWGLYRIYGKRSVKRISRK